MEFPQKSYELHAEAFKEEKNDQEELELYRNWFNNGTVDVWRHMRMLEVLNPFLELNPGAKWLTVGDGRFGTSAIYINQKGGNALATDIRDDLLQVAVDNGMLNEFRKENAEALSFEDNSFHYSFCKEAYHHFPRPYAAIYEMLRVSKEAIVFVEPHDWLPAPIPRRILQLVKNGLKRSIGSRIPHPDEGNYEEIGNYVYNIGEREFQKVALGLALPMVAFKVYHDIYLPGVEAEKMSDDGPLFKKIKRQTARHELLCKLGLSGRNHISAIMFKREPSQEIINNLEQLGHKVIELPKNPYL